MTPRYLNLDCGHLVRLRQMVSPLPCAVCRTCQNLSQPEDRLHQLIAITEVLAGTPKHVLLANVGMPDSAAGSPIPDRWEYGHTQAAFDSRGLLAKVVYYVENAEYSLIETISCADDSPE